MSIPQLMSKSTDPWWLYAKREEKEMIQWDQVTHME
jgi:hypothetical protein